MNKMRFIPLLALTALLSGCNLFGGAKAPNFVDSGDEVTFVQFKEKYLQAARDNELNDFESKLTDRVFKRSFSSTIVETIKRDKKEISNVTNQMIASGESQFDVNNLTGKAVAEVKSTTKIQDAEEDGSATSTTKYESYAQFEKVSNALYLVNANAKTKEYTTYERVSGTLTKEVIFDNYMRDDLLSIMTPFNDYMPANLKDGSDNLFYNYDDIMFTYSKAKESEDNSYAGYNEYNKFILKAQLDLTDRKQALRLSYENKIERTYKRNEDGHHKGDVLTREEKIYYDYTITAKDITVKPVDFSQYVAMI